VSSKVPTYPLRGTSGGFYFREADGDDERFEVTKVDPKGPSFGILEVAAECFQQVSNVYGLGLSLEVAAECFQQVSNV